MRTRLSPIWVAYEQEGAPPVTAAYFPWQFSVEDYGAKGDGLIAGDGSISSGSNSFSTPSYTFTAADNNKRIMINGALGSANVPLTATISSTSGGAALLSASATQTITGAAAAVWGTDDTAAINLALAAAKTYALANGYFAEAVFQDHCYILGSDATQSTTPAQYNAQILIPYPDLTGAGRKLVIGLTGVGDNGYYQFWESTTPNVSGTALISIPPTLAPSTPSGTYGEQSVIGGPSSGACFTGLFANTKVVVKGLQVVCGAYTNQYAYDFGYLAAMRIQQSSAHIFAPTGVGGGTGPVLNGLISQVAFQSTIGCGLRAPAIGNNADTVADDFTAEGYARGLYLFDHFTAGRVGTIYNDVAVVLDGTIGVSGTSHGVFIALLSAEAYNGGILVSGGSFPVYIRLDAECTGVAYDVSDVGDGLRGEIRWTDPADTRAPVITGAASVKVINDKLGPGIWTGAMTPAVPGVPASTSPQVNTSYRDAEVVITSGGAAVTAVAVNGTATGLALGTTGSVTVPVPSGASITLTYASTAPTWVWVLM